MLKVQDLRIDFRINTGMHKLPWVSTLCLFRVENSHSTLFLAAAQLDTFIHDAEIHLVTSCGFSCSFGGRSTG